ncbi:MAG: hypothetical protein EBW76_06995 [Actinobacteria bacterium]|jgi:hypothetical protein|nr:hypothetical protein [Actinomycetota bacterium]NCW93012.1 hypothetical protein [Actinomycetota bacterium]NCX16905.1 hypothetical protein [Actinomycetota bacterium]
MDKGRTARPWDLFNKKIGRVTEMIAKERLEICQGCEHFIKLSSQCKKCGCIMNLKTKLPNASCPVGKWDVFIPEVEVKKYSEEDLLKEDSQEEK